ncbi:lipoxygenase homology domain-containing protein 1-like isoform X2 [Lineus longissimus]|uniref:lipoxygenase homology domain-containing protein 1-like isoform X2 n=1 Tax=Lineus longissimus TaxID=88925 RepID=UPI002B4CEE96
MDIHGYYGSMSVYNPEERTRIIDRTKADNPYSSSDRRAYTWAEPSKKSPLYSATLQNICRRTQSNLDRLLPTVTVNDACHEYGIKHWHPERRAAAGSRPQSAHALSSHPERAVRKQRPSWQNHDIMFTSRDTLNRDEGSVTSSTVSSSTPINFCYLCSTLEEHEAHMKKDQIKWAESKEKRRERIVKAQTMRSTRLGYQAPPVIPMKKQVEEAKEPDEVLFKITVKTAYKDNAGTNAPVFVTLFGKMNEATRELKKGKKVQSHVFVKGAIDTFYIKTPVLGDSLKMDIWTQSDGNERLFLTIREILVTDVKAKTTWYGDYRSHPEPVTIADNLEKKLRGPTKMKLVELELEEAEYEITVITGKKRGAATDAKVSITLYGKKGVSEKLELRDKTKDLFEKGSTDLFLVTLPESLGPLSKVRIEHDNSGMNSNWFLDKVIVKSLATDKSYVFDCNDWLATDEGDGNLYRFLKVRTGKIDTGKKNVMTNFTINVTTGTKKNAGTDAKVFVQILGDEVSTGELFLEASKEHFEKGKTDTFRMPAKDTGMMKKLRIWHDNAGLAAGWYLEKVVLERRIQRPEMHEMLVQQEKEGRLPHGITLKNLAFTLDKYFGKKEPGIEKKTKKKKRKETSESEDLDDYFGLGRSKKKKELAKKKPDMKKKGKGKKKEDSSDSDSDADVGMFGFRKKIAKKAQVVTPGRSSNSDEDSESEEDIGRSRKIPIPYIEECEFLCQRWLDKKEDDKKTERILSVTHRNLKTRMMNVKIGK